MPTPTPIPIPFPGRLIQAGETDGPLVLSIQRQLNAVGCGPLEENGTFGKQTRDVVKLFQGRFPDTDRVPLAVDGQVGPITWAALFGEHSIPVISQVGDPLLTGMLDVAASQIGVREEPPGSNRGPRVDEYLCAVGLNPAAGSFAWCVAFVYWCAQRRGRPGATQSAGQDADPGALENRRPQADTAGVGGAGSPDPDPGHSGPDLRAEYGGRPRAHGAG